MIKCPECGKWFKSLGYARHRAMHYDKRRAANQCDSKNSPALPVQQTKATINSDYSNHPCVLCGKEGRCDCECPDEQN